MLGSPSAALGTPATPLPVGGVLPLLLLLLLVQPMSEDYPASSDGGSDDGGYGLMDDKDEKELMVECGQRQVRRDRPAAATTTQ